MMSVGLEEVETYFLHRHNTATQYIMTCLILELCMVAKQRPGAWVTRRWWYQYGLNFGKEDGRVEE